MPKLTLGHVRVTEGTFAWMMDLVGRPYCRRRLGPASRAVVRISMISVFRPSRKVTLAKTLLPFPTSMRDLSGYTHYVSARYKVSLRVSAGSNRCNIAEQLLIVWAAGPSSRGSWAVLHNNLTLLSQNPYFQEDLLSLGMSTQAKTRISLLHPDSNK